MHSRQFERWTRRRLGLAGGGFAAALLGFGEVTGDARKRKRRKKRCKKLCEAC